MAKGKKIESPMDQLAEKAQQVLKGKKKIDVTKEEFNTSVKKAIKQKGRSSK